MLFLCLYMAPVTCSQGSENLEGHQCTITCTRWHVSKPGNSTKYHNNGQTHTQHLPNLFIFSFHALSMLSTGVRKSQMYMATRTVYPSCKHFVMTLTSKSSQSAKFVFVNNLLVSYTVWRFTYQTECWVKMLHE